MGQAISPARESRFVKTAPDLNGDGTGDVLAWFEPYGALLALSGADGSTIWSYVPDADGRGGPLSGYPLRLSGSLGNSPAGEPAIADVDRDGIKDVIATMLLRDPSSHGKRRKVLAISGRSGQLLWRYRIEDTPIKVTSKSELQPAELVRGKEWTVVACVDGSQWVGLDPATGEVQAGPIELGCNPLIPVQHADLDGDGEPEVLIAGARADAWATDIVGLFIQEWWRDVVRDHRPRL